jgi:hypothetical protein
MMLFYSRLHTMLNNRKLEVYEDLKVAIIFNIQVCMTVMHYPYCRFILQLDIIAVRSVSLLLVSDPV